MFTREKRICEFYHCQIGGVFHIPGVFKSINSISLCSIGFL